VQFFESGDVNDLATQILFLMHDPIRRAELRARSAEFIAHNNWDVRKLEYLDLVDRLKATGRLTAS
jgi:hypothetical protein